MPTVGVTRTCTIRSILGTVDRAGGSITRVFRRAGLSPHLVEDSERLILLKEQFALLDATAREIGDPAAAARMSIEAGIGGLGGYGHAIIVEPTLGDALRLARDLLPSAMQTATRVGIDERGRRHPPRPDDDAPVMRIGHGCPQSRIAPFSRFDGRLFVGCSPAGCETVAHDNLLFEGRIMALDGAHPIVPMNAMDTPAKAPPHPLDGKWHLHLDNQVYGPYTGHEIKAYIADGRMDGTTSVIRVGNETWTKAAEDPQLGKLFALAGRTPAAPTGINAERGATVVNVTNQLSPNPGLSMLEEGEYGPKSAGVALLLSFLFCGAGQMYNGQVAKGFLMLIGCVLLWFVLLGWTIWIWSMIDAYQTAKKMNARYLRRLVAGLPI